MSSEKHTKFYYFGWAALWLGIAAAILFLVNVKCAFLPVFEFGPTTTACFTLAGLFFVLDNLKLQRIAIAQQQTAIEQQSIAINLQKDEVRIQTEEFRTTNSHFDAQNKALISQQYQTTFFSLLNGHTTLVNSLSFYNIIGFEGWSNYYNDALPEVQNYASMIKRKYFEKDSLTSLNPRYSLEKNKHSLESVLGDVVTLIKLIDEKLPEQLYYDILYNYLTVYEKYFIGLYCDCFENEFTMVITKHKYNFLKYYKEQQSRYHLSPTTYFPQIKITRNSATHFYRSHLKVTDPFLDFYIWKERDVYGENLVLDKIKVHVYLNGDYNLITTIFQENIEDDLPALVGELSDYSDIHLMPYLINQLLQMPLNLMYVNFDFHFNYQKQKVTVRHKLKLNLYKAEQQLTDLKEKYLFDISDEQ